MDRVTISSDRHSEARRFADYLKERDTHTIPAPPILETDDTIERLLAYSVRISGRSERKTPPKSIDWVKIPRIELKS